MSEGGSPPLLTPLLALVSEASRYMPWRLGYKLGSVGFGHPPSSSLSRIRFAREGSENLIWKWSWNGHLVAMLLNTEATPSGAERGIILSHLLLGLGAVPERKSAGTD